MLTHVSKTARLFRIMLFEIYWKMAVLKLPFPVMLGSEALDGKWKRKPSLEPPFQMFMNMFSVSSRNFFVNVKILKALPTYLLYFSELNYPELYFSKCTQFKHLQSFASLFSS